MKKSLFAFIAILFAAFSISFAQTSLPADQPCLTNYNKTMKQGFVQIGECQYYYEYYVGWETFQGRLVPSFQVTKFGKVSPQDPAKCPKLTESEILGNIYSQLFGEANMKKLGLNPRQDEFITKIATCYKYIIEQCPTNVPISLIGELTPFWNQFGPIIKIPNLEFPDKLEDGLRIPIEEFRVPCGTVCCQARYLVYRDQAPSNVIRAIKLEDVLVTENKCTTAPCTHFACNWNPQLWKDNTPDYGYPTVSPNPFTDIINVSYTDKTRTGFNEFVTIEVIDAETGVVVLSITVQKNSDKFSTDINLSGLPKGKNYIVRVTFNKGGANEHVYVPSTNIYN